LIAMHNLIEGSPHTTHSFSNAQVYVSPCFIRAEVLKTANNCSRWASVTRGQESNAPPVLFDMFFPKSGLPEGLKRYLRCRIRHRPEEG